MTLFSGAMPTAPDVKRLTEQLGKLSIGQEISHEAVEAILNTERNSSRYRTVTGAWRRLARRDDNLQIEAVPGRGFRVLTGVERLQSSRKKAADGFRKVGRAAREAAAIPDAELNADQRVKRDHFQMVAAKMVSIASAEMKVELPKPSEQVSQLRLAK